MNKLSILLFSFLTFMVAEASSQNQSSPENGSQDGAFQVENIALLNSMDEFSQRAPETKIVGGFIKTIEATVTPIANKAFATEKTPHNGLITVAIRPDGTSKFWIDVGDEFRPQLTSELESAMDSVGTPKVTGGPIAFSLNFQIWGGVKKAKVKQEPAVAPPRIPIQWQEAVNKNKNKNKKLRVPDDLLPLVWPADESTEQDAEEKTFVPDGFVLQSLDPLGGSILRPTDWHYTQGATNQGVTWTISKEPVEAGYTTGVRIQLIVGIKKATGKTPEEFVSDFLETKKKKFKVLSERKATRQGEFTRVGLETEEPQPGKKDKPFRILYSCFWNDETDMTAITISGTTTELWEEYRQTFDTMTGLTLVDLKKAKPNKEHAID